MDQAGTSSALRRRDVRARTARVLAVIASFAALVIGSGATAQASTHHYCIGCTINGFSPYEDGYNFWLLLDYVHRLSGPYCTTIGAYASWTDGTIGTEVLNQNCSDDVQHGFNGNRYGAGGAFNHGAGNYGFNAHVDY
jgi:hypothetical protein